MARAHRGAGTVGILLLAGLFAGCFGEPEDEDGLDTEIENEGYEITVTGLDGVTRTRHVTSSPHDADEDRDGLDDFQERLEQTDPRNPDTDGDGLLDGANIRLDADDPLVAEWQEAGIVFVERGGGLHFLGERGTKEVRHGGDPRDADTDDDGLPDGMEVGGFTLDVNGAARTVFTLAHAEDSDFDGLKDGFERQAGLDPSLRDTDGDNVTDFGDVDPWRDAMVAFRVTGLAVDNDPANRGSLPVFVQGNVHGLRMTSAEVVLQEGEAYNGTAFDEDALDVPDTGGEVLRGRHNVSFLLTFLSEDRSGEPVVLDLFSETVGATSLIGRLHMIDGTLRLGSATNDMPWPADGTFRGAHGTVTLALAPVR